MMYESVTPVWAGEILKRVPTVRRETASVSRMPMRSRRMPSQRWFVTVSQYARFSTSTRFLFSSRKRSVSPYARMVARPESDSEKWLYRDDRSRASRRWWNTSVCIQSWHSLGAYLEFTSTGTIEDGRPNVCDADHADRDEEPGKAPVYTR